MIPDKTPHDRTQMEFIGELRDKLVKLLRLFKIGMTVSISVIIILLTIVMVLGTKLYRTQQELESRLEVNGNTESMYGASVNSADTNNADTNNAGTNNAGIDSAGKNNTGSYSESSSESASTAQPTEATAAESSKAAGSSKADGSSKAADKRIRVYLTFDDGPSSNTGEILDILKEYNVKGTFFVVGKTGSEYEKLYRRIVDEGSTLGMHSYSHDYAQIYSSLDAFQTDLHKIQNYLYDVTGVWTTYYRFPGGSSNTASKTDMSELEAYLGREHISYYDWNIYGGDNVSSRRILDNIENSVDGRYENMILLHDASDKKSTVLALPHIIQYYQAEPDKYQIVPITEETVPVQHKRDQ